MPRFARGPLVVLLVLGCTVAGAAQGRTDIVTLANGDRITGEVLRLERGRLEFKTDDAGTLRLEWDKLTSVLTTRLVEVGTGSGMTYLGSLVRAPSRAISVSTPGGEIALQMPEVTAITPIGRSFWRKLDGSVDAGFNYTQSSGIAQMTLNSDTVYRRPASQLRLAGSMTLTRTEEDEGRDDRATVDMSYQRNRAAAMVRDRLRTLRDQRESRPRAAVAGRRRDRPAPGEQQPGAAQYRRRARRQRGARRRRRGDTQRGGGVPLPDLVFHLRPADHEPRCPGCSTTPA